MTTPLAHMNVQHTFESNKDNPQVQALLNLLRDKKEQVIEWRIDNYAHDPNYATFCAVFDDESEVRGYISFFPVSGKWLAGGAVISAFQAKRIRESKEQGIL